MTKRNNPSSYKAVEQEKVVIDGLGTIELFDYNLITIAQMLANDRNQIADNPFGLNKVPKPIMPIRRSSQPGCFNMDFTINLNTEIWHDFCFTASKGKKVRQSIHEYKSIGEEYAISQNVKEDIKRSHKDRLKESLQTINRHTETVKRMSLLFENEITILNTTQESFFLEVKDYLLPVKIKHHTQLIGEIGLSYKRLFEITK